MTTPIQTITGGKAEFIEGQFAQEQQGCKAIYTVGNIQFFIFLDDTVLAFPDSVNKIGDPILAIPPGTKGRIETQSGADGNITHVLLLEKPSV